MAILTKEKLKDGWKRSNQGWFREDVMETANWAWELAGMLRECLCGDDDCDVCALAREVLKKGEAK